MLKRTVIIAVTLLPFCAQGDQRSAHNSQPTTHQAPASSAPKVLPWHKPVYPQSQADFVEGFKQAGYALVCGVKEARECLGFTNECLTEISANTDRCVTENSSHVPASFATADETKPVSSALFACMTEKQRLSGKGQMSVAACNTLNEMRKQAAKPAP
jgi:hypothetical protein